LAKIIAAHIVGHLEEVGHNQDTIIIAIPNDLDEFGQEGLLQEFKRQGLQNVKLIWRPVAAALAWLERTQNAFPQQDIPTDDFILVAHLGPDCMEFVPFRLRKKECQGRHYVIPLREPPKVKVVLGGCDWAADLIDNIVDANDSGAFWRALTGFPEVWETMAHRDWNREQLPHIWSRGDSWELWNPPLSLDESMWQVAARKSVRLSELTRSSCLDKRPVSSDGSWLELIQTWVKQAAEVYRGQLRGMILSGPLASSLSSCWLERIIPFLQGKGLRTSPSPEAMPDGIWVPGFECDAVAEGAAIYGTRLLSGEPTYLDILPQLWMYAQDRGKLGWVALLDAVEVEGGRIFKRVLEQKFSLPGQSKTLQVFLKKGNEQIRKASFHFPYASEEPMPLDTHIEMSPASGLAQVELVPIKKDFLRGQRVFLDYSLMEDATETDLPKPKLGFPPLTKILVDPDDRNLLSEVKTSWDKFREIHIGGDLQQYCEVVKELKEAVTKSISFLSASNRRIRGRIVDQDGKAGTSQGQELIKHISAKLGKDLRALLDQLHVGTTGQRRDIMRDIRLAATWLFAGAPPEVISYLKSELQTQGWASQQHVIKAASRVFTEVGDLGVLYKAIYKVITDRAGNPDPRQPRRPTFPNNSARALYRVMQLRESSPDAMIRPEAETFVEQTLINMEECVKATNFETKFFQAARLFLYLLRYREIDQTFLLYDNPQDSQLFDRTIRCLETAQNFFQSKRHDARAEKAANIMGEIKKYMFFEGSPDIIEVINELAGEDPG
jgi:hypothetical protein